LEDQPRDVVPLPRRRLVPGRRKVAQEFRRPPQDRRAVAGALQRREFGGDVVALGEVRLSGHVAPRVEFLDALAPAG
jgi:hypothetical protein